MSQAVLSKSLIAQALPQSGAARFLAQAAVVIAGSMALVLSAKTKVVIGPVDISLQTMVVMLLASTLGLRLGLATIGLYLLQGAMGYPVFQSTPEKGIGLAYMAGLTGGYLAGFVVMMAIVGWAADRGWSQNVVKLFAAMVMADAVLLAMGASWLGVLIGFENAWAFGVAPFVVPDLIKAALAACLVPAGWSAIAAVKRLAR